MEVWDGIWKKILLCDGIWNGKLLVCNGNRMEENCQYGIRKIVFHSIPCPRQHKSNKIAYKVNLSVFCFFTLNTINCFILSRDVGAEAGSHGSGSTLMKETGSGSALASV